MRVRTSVASPNRSCSGFVIPHTGMSLAMIGGGNALVMRSAMAKPGWPNCTRAESLIAALVLIVPNVMTWATLSLPHRSVA
ncbi:Uncharacterised protein [Mycobacteroides abscessus subsp. abscessus]|nr:Uncharacterised protein [Mycobacteroides abscessus subsp. abscessus]